MATVRAILRKKGSGFIVNRHNEGLLLLQYQHQTKCCWFTTKMKVRPEHWNSSKQAIDKTKGISNAKNNQELLSALERESKLDNVFVDTMKSRISAIARDFQFRDIEPTAQRVKEEYEKRYKNKVVEDNERGFFKLFEKFINSQRSLKSEGTIKQYWVVYHNLELFEKVKKEKITLEKINHKLYEKILKYYLEDHIVIKGKEGKEDKKGMVNNTVGHQIKILKVFLEYLKKEKLINNVNISEFKVWKEKPVIIFLNSEELDALYKTVFTDERLSIMRDLFLLQCYTGLRISDLLRLSKTHIQGDVIRMRAHKNKKDVTVPLTPRSLEILERYNYELPKVHEQKLNEAIKVVCKEAGIDSTIEVQHSKGGDKVYTSFKKYEKITSHTAVKTFITACSDRGISPKIVSEIVGKTVKVIMDHYYGVSDKTIKKEMAEAFGRIN